MATPAEIDRIAQAMNAIRPDWRVTSLVTFLTKTHADRAYRDLAVAAIAVATDPKTTTPRLLNEHGPWWVAAQTASGSFTDTRFTRCQQPGHSSFPAANCSACRSEDIAGEGMRTDPRQHTYEHVYAYTVGPPMVRRAMKDAGIPTNGTTQPNEGDLK